MIKVAYLIDSLGTGGAETSLTDMALKFKDITPIFIYVYKNDKLKEKLISNNIEVHSLNVPDGYNFDIALQRLLPLIKSIQPDILHSTLFNSDIIARRLKKVYPVILINSFVNNSYSTDRYSNLSWANKTKLFGVQMYDRITSRNVDYYISNSQAIKITNARALNISPDKIKVIHRGRDEKKFSNFSPISINKLQEELNLEKFTILLNVGRLLERKGQLDLLIAFKELLETRRNLKLLIAGEGGFKKNLQDYITEHNLGSYVFLLGNRKDVPELLNLADFFIFPSWFEGLPGSLIEAMMAGTPVIASNIPENLECINEEIALIFKKSDPVDLKNKLLWALDNESEMREKAKEAKSIAKSKFDINYIVEEYEKTYLSLIENNSILPSQSTYK